MLRTDAIALMAALMAPSLSDAAGQLFDKIMADEVSQQPVIQGFTQDQMDAAVAAGVTTAQAADAVSLAQAQAQAQSALQVVQAALDSMTAKEQLEEQAVAGLQSSIGQVQSALDAIKAIIIPAPIVPVV